MNVIEAYIKFKGQLVILVSGLSGSGISVLAKNISRDFEIPLIHTKDYCKKDYNVTAKIRNDVEIINWDTDDVYDWEKLNNKIKEVLELQGKENELKKGIVVVGTVFPNGKINIPIDYHLHIKLSK